MSPNIHTPSTSPSPHPMQVCKTADALMFDARCIAENGTLATAPCEVQWALQASEFALGSACAGTGDNGPTVWTNTSADAAMLRVAALVQQFKGSADGAQMQL
jgi:hypothetical protein